MEVNPGPLWATGRVNRSPPPIINMANMDRRMVVVPNTRRDCRGGSDSATVGDRSRRRRSRIMFSAGLRRRWNDMFSGCLEVRRLGAAE